MKLGVMFLAGFLMFCSASANAQMSDLCKEYYVDGRMIFDDAIREHQLAEDYETMQLKEPMIKAREKAKRSLELARTYAVAFQAYCKD